MSVDVETELSDVVCIEPGLDECEETCPSLLLPTAVESRAKGSLGGGVRQQIAPDATTMFGG